MFFAIAVVAASLHGLASSSGRAATLSSSRQRDGGRRAGRYTSLGEAAVDARMVAAVATDPRVRLELERVSKMQWFIPHWRPRCFQPPRPSDYAASPRRRGRRRGPSLTHSAAPRETVATPRPPIAKASTSDLSRNTWSLKVEKQLLVQQLHVELLSRQLGGSREPLRSEKKTRSPSGSRRPSASPS